MTLLEQPPSTTTPPEVLPEAALDETFESKLMLSIHAIANSVREEVANELEVWQELPLLGLHANGKNGRYEHELTILSTHGIYKLDDDPAFPANTPHSIPGLFGYYVSCDNAAIIRLKGDPKALGSMETAVTNEELAAVVGRKVSQNRLGDFSASSVRSSLLAVIESPESPRHSPSSEASRQAYITREIARLGLSPVFTR